MTTVGIDDIDQAYSRLTHRCPAHGHGFCFMKSFMDYMNVESSPGDGTTVKLTRNLGQQQPGPGLRVKAVQEQLSQERVEELIRAAQEGERQAEEEIFTANLGLVYMALERFKNTPYDFEDLFESGLLVC